LVMRYKTTTLGTQFPDRWALPEALRDTTGVVLASAFPGYNPSSRTSRPTSTTGPGASTSSPSKVSERT
ncbi:MAG TPA: hypothetical protein VHM65_11410, partial [Candidatus Lustribacter sp.]|nr:hypothetical protein [Candidatus Lustribacter sp.]